MAHDEFFLDNAVLLGGKLNRVARFDDWLQELFDHPTVRRMRQIAPEGVFIVEINDDREIPVALREPEIRTERQTANLGDRSCVRCEMFD